MPSASAIASRIAAAKVGVETQFATVEARYARLARTV
jgi:hypothetical protein